MAQKILVIGSPGAGKSTFARKLRDKTGLPLIYLDQIWHKADRTTVSTQEFDARLSEILLGDRWIIDGNYTRTLEPRLAACDGVFLLDYPAKLCLESVAGRVGSVREDMPWVERKLDPQFARYIEEFPTTRLPKIYRLLEEYRQGREIVVFHNREESENYLKNCP